MKLSLQSKFFLGVASFCLFLSIIFILTLYFHMKNIALEEVKDKANLTISYVEATQKYVRSVLRPKMFNILGSNQFIIEAMSSSYITRKIAENFNPQTGYFYRRVSINARNKKYEANDFERKLIAEFKTNKLKEWEGIREIDHSSYYLVVRPVIFEKSCLKCHGLPSKAPLELIKKYGDKGGFYRKEGEIGGAVVVGLAIDDIMNNIKDVTIGYIFIYSSIFLIFAFLVSIYFRQIIIVNFNKITSIFKKLFVEANIQNNTKTDFRDEVEEMVYNIEVMATEIYKAREKLREYANTLEDMVKIRTKKLEEEIISRKKDIELFIKFVDVLSKSRSNEDLIFNILKAIADRMQIEEAAYVCMLYSNKKMVWSKTNKDIKFSLLPIENLKEDTIVLEDGWIYILVHSQDRRWGTLVIPETKYATQNKDVLIALGKQMGMALESIQSVNELIYQYKTLQSLFDGIADPLFLIDENKNIIIQNIASLNLDKKIKKDFWKLFLNSEKIKKELDKPLTNGTSSTIKWNVDNLFFEVSMYPLIEDQHGLKRMIIYIRDISKEVKMQEQIRRTEKLSAVGKLAAGLAHEINNPLGVILCYVDLLRESIVDEQGKKDLEVIEKHTKQAQKILKDLLNFARPKSYFGVCNLEELLKNISEVFKVQAKKKEIDFQVEIKSKLPLLKYDSSILEQIFTNLILNAFDVVEEKQGKVKISVDVKEEFVVIEVRDNGPGIPDTIANFIFDPFFTTKEVGKGTGLGLAVVYGLVEELKGKIEFFNDKGAVFVIYLPLNTSED